jgi:enoyl-CoA hydratase/carnithine racemase
MHCVTSEPQHNCVILRLESGETNVLNTEVLKALKLALDKAATKDLGIMLSGGDKFFSNGVDLSWALTRSPAQIREMFLLLGDLILSIMESPVPIVGAIKGHAIGGAMAILMACDYRYAATGRVLLGKPEILLGVPNPFYGDQLLRFVAGDFVASDLIYTGKLITGEQAHSLNIIHAVDSKDCIEDLAWQQLRVLRALAPTAFSESKQMRSAQFCATMRAQMSTRVARQVEIWNSDDAQTQLHEAAARLKR